MWRHFPHHSHAICGEISDFYTSVTRRNLKLLHMWRKFRFLHICHVERFEITLHVEKFQKSPHLSCIEIWNFSTWQFFSPQIYWWDWWQISGMQSLKTKEIHLQWMQFYICKITQIWYSHEETMFPCPGLAQIYY